MVWHVRHNRALHENLFVLTVGTEPVPWVKHTERLIVGQIAPSLLACGCSLRFHAAPDILALLQQAQKRSLKSAEKSRSERIEILPE
jgi:KUP system potassium uptake protein